MSEREYKRLPSPREHWFGSWGVEDPHGRWWRNMRANYWMGFGDRDGEAATSVHVGGEWVHGRRWGGLSLKVSTSGEETLDVHYGIGPLLAHYWNLTVTRTDRTPTSKTYPAAAGRGERTREFYQQRQVRLPPFRFTADLGVTQLRWCFGRDDHSWSRDAPLRERLRRGDLHWLRLSRGYRCETPDTVASERVEVQLPEGAYPATVTLQREVRQWKLGPLWMLRGRRRRWSRGPAWCLPIGRKVGYIASLRADTMLPHPGKGENSWDCGQDGLVECSAVVRAPRGEHDREWVAAAVGKAVQSVLADRMCYGRSLADTGA